MPSITPSDRRRRWNAVDRGMVHLVKVITTDEWDVGAAARHLAAKVPAVPVLKRMAARAERSLVERPSPIAHRAATTVRAALALRGCA